jgi:hypothetical protein
MGRPFKKAKPAEGGAVVARFTEGERDVLRMLLITQLNLLDVEDPLGPDPDPLAAALGIGAWGGGPVKAPDDPALARLFPDAYRGDDEQAGEFRRLTEPDLREGKRANARTALATMDGYEPDAALPLDVDQAQAWLGAVNDIRQVLSVWLEIKDDYDDPFARIMPDDPRFDIAVYYDWLGALVECLVQALPL